MEKNKKLKKHKAAYIFAPILGLGLIAGTVTPIALAKPNKWVDEDTKPTVELDSGSSTGVSINASGTSLKVHEASTVKLNIQDSTKQIGNIVIKIDGNTLSEDDYFINQADNTIVIKASAMTGTKVNITVNTENAIEFEFGFKGEQEGELISHSIRRNATSTIIFSIPEGYKLEKLSGDTDEGKIKEGDDFTKTCTNNICTVIFNDKEIFKDATYLTMEADIEPETPTEKEAKVAIEDESFSKAGISKLDYTTTVTKSNPSITINSYAVDITTPGTLTIKTEAGIEDPHTVEFKDDKTPVSVTVSDNIWQSITSGDTLTLSFEAGAIETGLTFNPIQEGEKICSVSANDSIPAKYIKDGVLKIPSVAPKGSGCEGYKVVYIEENAFGIQPNISEIVVPDSVIQIGKNAFGAVGESVTKVTFKHDLYGWTYEYYDEEEGKTRTLTTLLQNSENNATQLKNGLINYKLTKDIGCEQPYYAQGREEERYSDAFSMGGRVKLVKDPNANKFTCDYFPAERTDEKNNITFGYIGILFGANGLRSPICQANEKYLVDDSIEIKTISFGENEYSYLAMKNYNPNQTYKVIVNLDDGEHGTIRVENGEKIAPTFDIGPEEIRNKFDNPQLKVKVGYDDDYNQVINGWDVEADLNQDNLTTFGITDLKIKVNGEIIDKEKYEWTPNHQGDILIDASVVPTTGANVSIEYEIKDSTNYTKEFDVEGGEWEFNKLESEQNYIFKITIPEKCQFKWFKLTDEDGNTIPFTQNNKLSLNKIGYNSEEGKYYLYDSSNFKIKDPEGYFAFKFNSPDEYMYDGTYLLKIKATDLGGASKIVTIS